jgi:hypothetical protein
VNSSFNPRAHKERDASVMSSMQTVMSFNPRAHKERDALVLTPYTKTT